MTTRSPDDVLRESALLNPRRVCRLIQRCIDTWRLDLSGLTVLTEAASGYYTVTPVLAAMAGAEKVLALTADSRFAKADEVVAQTRALEKLCDVQDRVDILTRRSMDLFAAADVVTNMGFVRPIDAEAIAAMKSTAVVSLMYHAWEKRDSDVDVEACRDRGILLMGTDEQTFSLNVFGYCGTLCQAMLFDAGLEVRTNRIVVVSSDRFGPVLYASLLGAGAEVVLIPPARLAERPEVLSGCDAVVLADYAFPGPIIGPDSPLSSSTLSRLAGDAVVIQFVGGADTDELAQYGLRAEPSVALPPKQMGRTFAHLGPKPVVDLIGAGVKVGEVMARARLAGLGIAEATARAMETSPAEPV